MRDRRYPRPPAGRASAARRAAPARVPRLRQRRHRDPGRGADRAPPRRGQARQSRARARGRAARRRDRHRPHPLGDPWRADPGQRPSARGGRGRGGPQRHRRELPAPARRADRQGPPLCHPDRYRGRAPAGQPLPHQRPRAGRGRRGRPQAAGWRVRARDPVRRPRRPVDLRPARQPARDRLWRRRDVHRLGCAGTGTPDQPDPVPGGGRLGGADRARRHHLCRRRHGSRARDQADRVLGRDDRPRQLPPLHAQGDPRAAGGAGGHAARLGEPGRPPDRAARAAGRSRNPAAARDGRLRHRRLCLHGRALLVRAAGRPAGRPRHRLGVPLSRRPAGAGQRGAVRLPVRRDHGHARGDARGQGAGAGDDRAGQRSGQHAGARGRLPAAHACRSRDRGRLDQGVHDPARDACLPRDRRGPGPRPPDARARGRADPGARRGAGARGRGPDAGRGLRADRAASGARPRRPLHRPRHELRDRPRGRLEAQGDQLHPRRGLRRRGAQARADRADRRAGAGDRGGAARPLVRQDREQPAGGGRARRQGHSI